MCDSENLKKTGTRGVWISKIFINWNRRPALLSISTKGTTLVITLQYNLVWMFFVSWQRVIRTQLLMYLHFHSKFTVGLLRGQGAQEYWDKQIWDQQLWASTQPLHHTYPNELVVLIELGPQVYGILFVSMYTIWSVITLEFSNLHTFSTMLVNGFWVVLLYFCRFGWYGWWYSHCTSESS